VRVPADEDPERKLTRKDVSRKMFHAKCLTQRRRDRKERHGLGCFCYVRSSRIAAATRIQLIFFSKQDGRLMNEMRFVSMQCRETENHALRSSRLCVRKKTFVQTRKWGGLDIRFVSVQLQ